MRRTRKQTGLRRSKTSTASDEQLVDDAIESLTEALRFGFDRSLGSALYAGSGPDKPTTVVTDVDATRSSEAASYRWHKAQKVETRRDGSVRMTFTCDNFAPVIAWILRFGSHAIAIKPTALVKAVAEQIRATSQLYERRRGRR